MYCPLLVAHRRWRRAEKQPDIILLDINMPGTDGAGGLPADTDHLSCPILFLTARIEDADKVKGFAAGGDDYIVKPFSLTELEARVGAHLRREARHHAAAQVRFSGDLTIDYAERCLFCGETRISLAKKNLTSWNCSPKIQGRSLIRSGFTSGFGAMTARGTAALWPSTSAGSAPKSRPKPAAHISKQSGGAGTNGSSNSLPASSIPPKEPCPLSSRLCGARGLPVRGDLFALRQRGGIDPRLLSPVGRKVLSDQ